MSGSCYSRLVFGGRAPPWICFPLDCKSRGFEKDCTSLGMCGFILSLLPDDNALLVCKLYDQNFIRVSF